MGYAAEKNLIGILMIDTSEIENVCPIVTPQMFTEELLGCFYLEILKAYDNHKTYSPESIIQAVTNDIFPEHIVRQELFKCITEGDIISIRARSYAAVIRNEYKAEQFGRILNDIKPSPASVDDQIGRTITTLEGLLDGKNGSAKTLPEIVKENKGKYFRDNDAERIKLGFDGIDGLLGGLEGGDVIVIGARPAVGKSAFVTQITENLAKSGRKIGFYNLEMREKQVYERFVVAKSGIGLNRLRFAKNFLGNEKEKFDKANEELEKQQNIVITTGSKQVSEIRSESRHMGYDVIVIDYLQLLRTDKEYRGSRYAEVGAISKAIKAMAMDFNIPIIVLSQLNRQSESRDIKEPTMAELRESGDIEQDASVIILMWNKDQQDGKKKGLKIEKSRQGATGSFDMTFNGDLMQFMEGTWMDVGDEENPFA